MRGRVLLPTDASRRNADGSGKHKFFPNSDFSTAFHFRLCAGLSCIISVFLKVLEGSYNILILFATIFHRKYSVFSYFLFFIFRLFPCFSNFPRYVIHSIHRFFHRFWRHFPCRTSQYSVFIWVNGTFPVIIESGHFNFFRTFYIF